MIWYGVAAWLAFGFFGVRDCCVRHHHKMDAECKMFWILGMVFGPFSFILF